MKKKITILILIITFSCCTAQKTTSTKSIQEINICNLKSCEIDEEKLNTCFPVKITSNVMMKKQESINVIYYKDLDNIYMISKTKHGSTEFLLFKEIGYILKNGDFKTAVKMSNQNFSRCSSQIKIISPIINYCKKNKQNKIKSIIKNSENIFQATYKNNYKEKYYVNKTGFIEKIESKNNEVYFSDYNLSLNKSIWVPYAKKIVFNGYKSYCEIIDIEEQAKDEIIENLFKKQ